MSLVDLPIEVIEIIFADIPYRIKCHICHKVRNEQKLTKYIVYNSINDLKIIDIKISDLILYAADDIIHQCIDQRLITRRDIIDSLYLSQRYDLITPTRLEDIFRYDSVEMFNRFRTQYFIPDVDYYCRYYICPEICRYIQKENIAVIDQCYLYDIRSLDYAECNILHHHAYFAATNGMVHYIKELLDQEHVFTGMFIAIVIEKGKNKIDILKLLHKTHADSIRRVIDIFRCMKTIEPEILALY